MAQSAAERQRLKRQRQRERGLKRFEVLARPEQEPLIRALEREMDRKWNKTHPEQTDSQPG